MSPLIGGSMQENIPRVRQNGSILQTSLLHTQEMDASRLALLCDEVSLANKPQASGACRSTGLAWLSVEQGKDIYVILVISTRTTDVVGVAGTKPAAGEGRHTGGRCCMYRAVGSKANKVGRSDTGAAQSQAQQTRGC